MYWLLPLAALLAGLGVVAGAFGAHGLEGSVTPARIDTFETGVRYHLLHAIVLVGIGWVMRGDPLPGLNVVAILMLIGILIFSGSLYLLVLTDTPWLGAVTPIGGVALIAGWLYLAWISW